MATSGSKTARRLAALLLCLVWALPVLAGCEKKSAGAPEDFEFSLTWGVYGISSYDSQTGRLVKTTDATHPEDYVTTHHLTQEERETLWQVIRDLDVESYPDVYDPCSFQSTPSATLILTVRSGGREKTVRCEDIALMWEGKDKKGQAFLTACRTISELLTATEEWHALPDYEFLYE